MVLCYGFKVYYQLEVKEKDKHKTAFVTPMGFWEFNRMPHLSESYGKMYGCNEPQGGLSLGHSGGTRGKTPADLEQEFGLKLSPKKC